MTTTVENPAAAHLKQAALELRRALALHANADQAVVEYRRVEKAANQEVLRTEGAKALGSNEEERKASYAQRNPGPLRSRREAEDRLREAVKTLEIAKVDWELAKQLAALGS